MSARKIPAAPIPHSWAIENWPAHVYPNLPGRGRYVVRANRDSLLAAGALTRVGRDIVVIGYAYQKWLESQQGRVTGFEIAPNRTAAEAAL